MTDPSDSPKDAVADSRRLFQRAEAVFDRLIGLHADERQKALGDLTAADPRLGALVQDLLRSAADLGHFLESPALGASIASFAQGGAQDAQDDLVGSSLGAFRIEHRIASGGMGTVYRAVRSDQQFHQVVAIKVVKRGLDTEEILARFRAERQTLAALDHPSIARLIDGGSTPDGRPYLVMEYVDGRPIDKFCDQNRLTVRERLKLFREVCQAVHHAHTNMVIHRDLKPSNILVTSQGVPKLLDFGIAKLMAGDTRHTADTDRRLTPEYASPEQVTGAPITTATDVYSLGVVLYELLTGIPPYLLHVRTTEELRRVVCGVQPPPPSAAITVHASRKRSTGAPSDRAQPTPSQPPGPAATPSTRGISSTRLRSVLRGDLDTIVLMALRKEPQRRYASAEQFSADIARYLDGLPVQARRDTAVYRASKFIRRHPAGVAATILIMIALSAATIMLANQSSRLKHRRDELLAANKQLRETRRYLQTVLSGAETGNQGPDARLGDVLRDAAATLANDPPDDALTRAAASRSIGRAMLSLGLLPEARRLLTDAQSIFETFPGSEEATSDVRSDLAELLYAEGNAAEAETLYRDLLAAERHSAGGAHTEREGLLLNNLGATLRVQGKAAEAESLQREAVSVRESVLGPQTIAVAESRNNLGSALFAKGDFDGAVTEFEKALSIRRALLRPGHPLIVRLLSNLGLAKLRAGDASQAADLLQEASQSWNQAFGPDHPGRVSTMTSLSLALRQLKRYDEATAVLQDAAAWLQAHRPDDAAGLAAVDANRAMALAEKGDLAQAEQLLTRALPILKSSAGKAAIARSASEALAKIYEQAGRLDEARALRAEPR